MTLLQLLASPHVPSTAVAFVSESTEWTYETVYRRVLQTAKGLDKHFSSLKRGDRVALLFWNQPECLISLLALRVLGLVPVPINLLMPPEDIAYVFKHAEIAALVGCESLALESVKKQGLSLERLTLPKVLCQQTLLTKLVTPSLEGYWKQNETLAELEAWLATQPPTLHDELALLLYTSGTTGTPKGVMISEANIAASLAGFQSVLQFKPAEHRFLLGIPLFHCYGLLCSLMALQLGATTYFVPKFQPKQLVHHLQHDGITILPLVPTMFTMILQYAKRLQSSLPAGAKPFGHLQWCISGGMALAAPLMNDIEATLQATVLEGYGMTETMAAIAVNSPQVGAKIGTVGQVVEGLQVRLCCPETQATLATYPCVNSPEGEIQVLGANVMQGYYHNPEATAEVVTPEGWLRTGDLGRFDENGCLVISGGRLKDLIIRAGENIAPICIERVLAQHTAVAEVACIPKKDTKLGEAILACIQPQPEATDVLQAGDVQHLLIQELKALVHQQLSPSFVPDAFMISHDLPKGPTGKILKKKLKEQYL
ncbi:MAG: class I adenylate-forming enzyme family protein [Vampirovibrionales bacterium]